MPPIIEVDRIGKKYRLGVQKGYLSLRDQLVRRAQSLLFRAGSRGGRGASDPQEFWALKDVSFTVNEGEAVGIIGRNGAGKSTLLKILSKITPPTTGRIVLRGRVASLLEVGTGFHPELTGRENIYLNGAILGMTRAEIRKKFDEIVDFAEIDQFLDTPVKRYSSGMYVRLAFAVAAHLESEVLLVDEVLAVGDVQFQKKCLGKMQEVTGRGRTVLFVSHNIPAMLSICQRSILIEDGLKVHDGISQDVVSHYLGTGNGNGTGEWSFGQNDGKSNQIIENIRLIDHIGNIVNMLAPGEPFGIEIKFSSKTKLNHLRCGIGIQDGLGSRIISLATFYDNQFHAPQWASKGILLCRANNINLSPGNYSITVTIGDNYTDIDRIEQALQFEVTSYDIFGTGFIPNRSQGNFWTKDQRWEIRHWNS